MTMVATSNHESMDERVSAPPSMAIALDGLVVKYGDKAAVDGLSLQVPVGSGSGFLGPHGSGRTTTIKALLCFKTIFFSSHSLSEVEEVADHVGIINKGKLVVSDDLDNLKQTHKVVRLLYAGTPAADDLAALRALPGVNRIEQEGRSIRIEASGD